MKKIINLTLVTALLGLSACTDSVMDEINENKENPAQETVPANIQITDAIMGTGVSAVSGDYAFYASVINEQTVGTGANQFWKAELRNSGELASPSTFNNSWQSVYENLENIAQCIDKVDNNIAASGQYPDVKGVAEILYVMNFQILTDLHGAIPYANALQGLDNMTPDLQSQKEIYASLETIIDDAISVLQESVEDEVSSMGTQDILYQGDVQKWLALAYAEKARLCIHQTNVDGNDGLTAAQNALDAANQAISNGFVSARLNQFDGSSAQNPWAAFIESRGYNAPSKTVVDLMTNASTATDPRLTHYITETAPDPYFTNPSYYGYEPGYYATPGDADFAVQSWTWNVSEWYYTNINENTMDPVHMFSDYELYFIKAEAEARLGQSYIEDLQKAIKLSVNEIEYKCGNLELADVTKNQIASDDGSVDTPGYAYAQNFTEQSLSDKDAMLKQIFTQKYIAFMDDEQIETYTDLRRIMAEKGTDDPNSTDLYVPMTNSYNTQGAGLNRWPFSYPYAESSINNNPNVKTYSASRDLYKDQLWLFGGAE